MWEWLLQRLGRTTVEKTDEQVAAVFNQAAFMQQVDDENQVWRNATLLLQRELRSRPNIDLDLMKAASQMWLLTVGGAYGVNNGVRLKEPLRTSIGCKADNTREIGFSDHESDPYGAAFRTYCSFAGMLHAFVSSQLIALTDAQERQLVGYYATYVPRTAKEVEVALKKTDAITGGSTSTSLAFGATDTNGARQSTAPTEKIDWSTRYVRRTRETVLAQEPVLIHPTLPVAQLFMQLTSRTCPHPYEDAMYRESLERLAWDRDEFGNYWKTVGDGESRSLFTAHLDTADHGDPKDVVHMRDAKGMLCTDGKTILGADDKAGVVVLLKMIERNVPGDYVLFAGEEVGCDGSRDWAEKNAAEAKLRWDRVVSFDRRGFDSVITEQSPGRTCSDTFAHVLASELNDYKDGKLFKFQPDPTGSFTDSHVFSEDVPECTNISVGYDGAHMNSEKQDLGFLEALIDAVCEVDWEKLPVVRDPSIKEKRSYGSYGSRGSRFQGQTSIYGDDWDWRDADETYEGTGDWRLRSYEEGTKKTGTGAQKSGEGTSKYAKKERKLTEEIDDLFKYLEADVDERFYQLAELIDAGLLTPQVFAKWSSAYPNAATELAYTFLSDWKEALVDLATLLPGERKFELDMVQTDLFDDLFDDPKAPTEAAPIIPPQP
jgi:Peptidase family M28